MFSFQICENEFQSWAIFDQRLCLRFLKLKVDLHFHKKNYVKQNFVDD